jgi:hypothetical protein
MLENLYKRLAALLEELLNQQTDLKFKVFVNVEYREDFFEEVIENYQVIEQKYIPVIIGDFSGDYIPLTNKKALNQSAIIYVVAELQYQEQVETILLNHLAPLIIGQQYALDTAQAVFNMSQPRNTDSYTFKGHDYVNFIFNIYTRIGEGFIFGNQVKYYLDDVELTPTTRQTDLIKSPDTNQVLNSSTSTTIIKENVKKTVLSFYYMNDYVYHVLAEEIETDTYQNRVYDLKIVYPGFEITRKVLLESGSINNPIGDFSNITVVFTKASEVLVDE